MNDSKFKIGDKVEYQCNKDRKGLPSSAQNIGKVGTVSDVYYNPRKSAYQYTFAEIHHKGFKPFEWNLKLASCVPEEMFTLC